MAWAPASSGGSDGRCWELGVSVWVWIWLEVDVWMDGVWFGERGTYSMLAQPAKAFFVARVPGEPGEIAGI